MIRTIFEVAIRSCGIEAPQGNIYSASDESWGKLTFL